MIASMERIRSGLSHRTPLPEFILMLKAAVQIDNRTRLGHDIQRCLLSNAADRLELIYATTPGMNPDRKNVEHVRWWASWGYFNAKLRDAWAVFRRRAVALYIH
jgi:hypothetical protein